MARLPGRVDYELEYKPGKDKVVADALRRESKLATINIVYCNMQDAIVDSMHHDPKVKQLVELVAQGKTRNFWVEDGPLLNAGQRIYVRKFGTIRQWIMKESHDTLWVESLESSYTPIHPSISICLSDFD